MTDLSPTRRLRAAFTDIYNPGWTAGAQYYHNLFLALRALEAAQQPEIIMIRGFWPKAGAKTGYRAHADELLDIPAEPYIPPPPPPNFVQRQRRRLGRWFPPLAPRPVPPPPPRPPHIETFLREQRVDFVFACWYELGPRFGLPLLGWIPDFQHVHLPDLFEPEELRQRDELFTKMAANCSHIILSSHDARADYERFSPEAAHKARVLPFVAQVPAEVYAEPPGWICEHYHLPERFVYLPDQFWQHKNHSLVLDALSRLRTSHPDITVVCTGNTNDNRAPLHFAELLAKIARLGLRNSFIVLGWVPHAHILHLMRQALAVLQPSRFEGWSTTVEEAKSLGKAILLSDIAVHREQAPPAARYFHPDDADALAEALVATFEAARPGPDAALEAQARADLPVRTLAFAENFLAIARDAVAHPPAGPRA